MLRDKANDCPDVLLSKHTTIIKISKCFLLINLMSVQIVQSTPTLLISLLPNLFAMQNGNGNRLVGGLVSIFIFFFFIFSLSSFFNQFLGGNFGKPNHFDIPRSQRESDPEFKIILLWNAFFADPTYGFRRLRYH